MAVVDLEALQPTTVSRDLKGKYICVYGEPGSGKTTLALDSPKCLVLGWEHGWNARSGIYAVDVASWGDFIKYLKQLEKPSMKEKFDNVAMDTIGIAWDKCVAYICAKNGVDKISEIPYGAGYSEVEKEFESRIVTLTQLGYGIIFIAHSDAHSEVDPENENAEIKVLGPDIPKRPYKIINRLVDITAFINQERDGSRWLCFRKTPTYFAKSRFASMPEKVPLGYESLVNAISDAIEAVEENGGTVVDGPTRVYEKETVDFNALVAEIKKYAIAMNKAEKTSDYQKIIAEYLGKGRNVMDCDEEQIEQLTLILDDLKDYAKENDLKV